MLQCSPLFCKYLLNCSRFFKNSKNSQLVYSKLENNATILKIKQKIKNGEQINFFSLEMSLVKCWRIVPTIQVIKTELSVF